MEGKLKSFTETHVMIASEHGVTDVPRKTMRSKRALDVLQKEYAKARARAEANRLSRKLLAEKGAEDE